MKKSRNSSIELLRFFFMLMIVTLHAYLHGSGKDFVYLLGEETSTCGHLGMFSLGMCGVTGFMFISGYYGLNFKWKKFGGMFATILFYMILERCIAGSGFKGIFAPWTGWWFVQAYMLVWLLSPCINKGIEYCSKKEFSIIVLGIMAYTYYSVILYGKSECSMTLLLTIYLAARYVAIYPPIYYRTNLSKAINKYC